MNRNEVMEFAQSVGKLSDIEYMRAKELIEARENTCTCTCKEGAKAREAEKPPE